MVKPNQLFPKAYFNWLRQQWELDPKTAVEPWQGEDYRELLTAHILERLNALGFALTVEEFLQVSENFKTPEELTHQLCPDKTNQLPIYLLLFELWRRLLPDKQSISVICDELDYSIKLYMKEPHREGAHLRNSLQRIEEILEKSVDEGQTPKASFDALKRHIAYDFEGFLYDYITDHIEEKNDLEASELLNTFYPYVSETFWFDFQKARLLILIDPHEGNLAFLSLLTQNLEIDLLLEIAAFLVHHGDPSLFQKTAELCLQKTETEEDFQELMASIGDYCHFVEKDDDELKIQNLFAKRIDRAPDQPFDPKDPDAAVLQGVLSQLQQTEI
jgi:hypothetical protein